MNPYQILGVHPKASSADIKTAFRKLASEHHPDKAGDADQFDQIKQAHDILMDDKRRAEYDSTGNTGKPRDISQLARSTIAQTFNKLLESHSFDANVDYVNKLQRTFTKALALSKKQRKDVKKHMEQCKALLDVTQGELLLGVIQQRLNTCTGQLAQIEEQVSITKMCQQLLEGCKCGVDLERLTSSSDCDDGLDRQHRTFRNPFYDSRW